MADHIIDTNVLLAASTSDPNSSFADTDHVPPDQLSKVLDWLIAFRDDQQRALVLDCGWHLFSEYKNKLGTDAENNIGLRVICDKMADGRFVDVPCDATGREKMPRALDQAFDYRGDRKIIALALADGLKSSIVNACDTDWYDWDAALASEGIVVEQIIGKWCKANWQKKKQRQASD